MRALVGHGATQGFRRLRMNLRRLRRAEAPPSGWTAYKEHELESGETWQEDE